MICLGCGGEKDAEAGIGGQQVIEHRAGCFQVSKQRVGGEGSQCRRFVADLPLVAAKCQASISLAFELYPTVVLFDLHKHSSLIRALVWTMEGQHQLACQCPEDHAMAAIICP